jgi:hypothetical protein
MNIQGFITKYINGGHEFDDITENIRFTVLNIMFIVAILSDVPGMISDFSDNKVKFLTQLIIFIVMISAWLYLRFHPKFFTIAMYIIILCAMGGIFIFFVTSAGTENYRVLSLMCFPAVAFFLQGRKKGFYLSLALAILCLGYVGIKYLISGIFVYSSDILSLTLSTYFFIVLLMYLEQGILDNKQLVILEKNKELDYNVFKLTREIEIRSRIESELKSQQSQLHGQNDQLIEQKTKLDQQNEELTRLNKMMIDRELKMVELKKDLEAITKELAQIKNKG